MNWTIRKNVIQITRTYFTKEKKKPKIPLWWRALAMKINILERKKRENLAKSQRDCWRYLVKKLGKQEELKTEQKGLANEDSARESKNTPSSDVQSPARNTLSESEPELPELVTGFREFALIPPEPPPNPSCR